jgi:hypothetical protein
VAHLSLGGGEGEGEVVPGSVIEPDGVGWDRKL